MKRTLIRRWGTGMALLLPVLAAPAITTDNPYAAIVDRNVFSLNPPAPPSSAPTTPVAPPSDVEFRGLSTLLGRPQALLNIKVKGAAPGAAATDRSLVMDIGQREGDVELLDIDMNRNSVRLVVQGRQVSMNLEDDAPKPQAPAGMPTVAPGAVAPGVAPAAPAPRSVPGAALPQRGAAGVAPATRHGASTSTPQANMGTPTLPARSIRANTAAAAAPQMTPEEQVAVMEVTREQTRDLVKQGVYPPMPPTPANPTGE